MFQFAPSVSAKPLSRPCKSLLQNLAICCASNCTTDRKEGTPDCTLEAADRMREAPDCTTETADKRNETAEQRKKADYCQGKSGKREANERIKEGLLTRSKWLIAQRKRLI